MNHLIELTKLRKLTDDLADSVRAGNYLTKNFSDPDTTWAEVENEIDKLHADIRAALRLDHLMDIGVLSEKDVKNIECILRNTVFYNKEDGSFSHVLRKIRLGRNTVAAVAGLDVMYFYK